MRRSFLAALLAALMPGAAMAQPFAADPDVIVPAVAYRPAFGVSPLVTPGSEINLTDWVQANADVGHNLRGHVDILKWELANAAPGQVGETSSAQVLLTAAQAVAQALRHQPDLIAPPQASALARAQIDARALALTHGVQRAWVNAVAARQTESHLRQVAQAAKVGVDLGQRMARVGNWSKMQLLQEQLVQSATVSQLALAQQASFSATEELVRRLGLWGSSAQLNLPVGLPELPADAVEMPALEASALRHQPELALARIEAGQAAAGVTQSHLRQWQLAVDTALQDAKRPADVDLGQHLIAPVLNTRQVPLTHALERAVHAQAQAHTLAVNTRSQAREAYYRWRTALDMAQHQRQAASLATALQEETQLRYNGMLSSTWDLLASARARLQSELAASQAQRDAWLAYIDLQAVLSGAVVSFSSISSAAGNAPATNPGH